MVVDFSKKFLKELQKHATKSEAVALVKKLGKTSPSEGDYIALVGNIVIREKKDKTFRFYFIVQNNIKHVVIKEELDEMIIKFVALSKKNDQQVVINKLKKDLQRFGFKIN